MSVFEFELVASGVLDDNTIDALFEAGCDDATFGDKDGMVTAAFAREAPDLVTAVISAITTVESVLGRGSVMRVEPNELVWAAEIAQRLGRSRQSVRLLVDGKARARRLPHAGGRRYSQPFVALVRGG